MKYKQIYSSSPGVRRPLEILRTMVAGLLHSRYMGYRLCLKDIRVDYSRSAFGFLWDFLDPLVLGVVFYFLKQSSVVNPGVMETPYPIYIIYGLFMYQTLVDATLLSIEIFDRSASLLSNIKLPPEAMLVAVFLRVGFYSCFRIAVMLAFSLYLYSSAEAEGLHAWSAVGFLKFLLLYPALILAGMSVGVLLAPFNVIYSDVGRFIRIVITLARYASPVLWVIPRESWIYILNPIAPLIDNLRLLAVANHCHDGIALGLVLGLTSLLFLLGWFIFHLSVPVLADRTQK